MSKRTSIVKALTEEFKCIDGSNPYCTNISGNAYPILKFWDEVRDFPSVYVTPGPEHREYLPSNFAWCYLTICIRVYCKGEDASSELEDLLEDLETSIDANRNLIYDTDTQSQLTEILVQSIVTDEGLLAPYAVGEITVQARYQKM